VAIKRKGPLLSCAAARNCCLTAGPFDFLVLTTGDRLRFVELNTLKRRVSKAEEAFAAPLDRAELNGGYVRP
jgi:hypothetical protein